MSITMQCAAAPRMQLAFQDQPPTEESLEGDAAHWVALQTALYYSAVAAGAEMAPPVKGQKAPNGVEITQDMLDGAELFADVVGFGAQHEQRVKCVSIHPHMYGTPDADRTDVEPDTLDVYDYKFGHRFVEVLENWQLVAYAVGVIETRMGQYGPKRIRFTIVQPRCYHPEGAVRSWSCSIHELRALESRMRTQALIAVDANGVPKADAPAATGPECRDCKARHACTLFQAVAARLVDSAGRADLFELPPPQLAAELSFLDATMQRLKARREGLAIQAETLLARGHVVPGYAMESSPGNLSWNDGVDVDEVSMLGNSLGVALCRDPEPVTPTQAKTILKRRALDPELLEAYTSRPRGKMKLVQSTTIKARKAFGASSK